jgi:small-conductance mechanosensitive channel
MENITILGWNINQLLTPENMRSIVRFLLLIFLGIPVTIFFSKWLRKYGTKKYSAQQGMIFSKIVLYGGLLFILISVLNEMGFKLSHLLGAAGIVGIAVGFASQTSVSNIISGFFLITEKPFEVNDVIMVGSTTGQVLSIDILSVKLRTFDNKFIRIPNETIIKSEVTTITKFPIRRVDLDIGVAYKEDIKRIRKILFEIAHKNPLCLNEPEPLILFSGFGNSSIDLKLLVWAVKSDWLSLKNTILEEIKQRFDDEGIEIPFPHLSLYSGSATNPIPVTVVNSDKTKN